MDAEVLFDYEKCQDDELSLKVGQIIHNVKEVDDGWCEGELNGLHGMFPDNFVKLKPAAAPAASHQPPPTSEPPTSSAQLRNIEPSRKIRRAKVAFSYTADNPDELTLVPGQIIEVLDEEEEGWWRGAGGGKEGVFPSNFVEEILEGDSKPPPIQHVPSSEPHSVMPPALVPVVDSQTGERPPPNGEIDGVKQHGVRGPMVMPTFDPSKARAQLKHHAAKATVAPPLEKPPEHKKSAPPPIHNQPSKPPEKPVERAKVTFDYDADNDDELTIKVGEIVDIVNKDIEQDGWWEVSLGDRRGLIPSNFVELLQTPAAQPKQPPAKAAPPPISKEPANKPPHPSVVKPAKKTEPKKPIVPATKLDSPEDQGDFPVPKTTPLDTSAIKDRPKYKNRPPSRSNLVNHEPETAATTTTTTTATTMTTTEESAPASEESGKNLSPWQAELIAKKKQPKLAPKPAGKPKPTVAMAKPDPPPVARSRINTGGSKPDASHLAKPPTPASASKPPLSKPPPSTKHIETKQAPPHDITVASESSTPRPASPASTPQPVVVDNAWKEAYEKLREDFDKFKEYVTRQIDILTDDLDKERKHRAAMDIDIDRIKKAQRSQ